MKKTTLTILLLLFIVSISYSQQTNPTLTKLNTALIKDDYQTALLFCDSLVMDDSTQMAQSNYFKALIYKSMLRFSDALAHINDAISQDTANIDFKMELGRIVYQRGKLSLADTVFSSIFETDTANLAAGIYLSRIKIKANKIQDALDVYLKLVELDSMNSYFNRQVGFCYIKIGKSNRAIPYLEQAIFLDSTDTKPYEHIAMVYQAKNMHDTAIYYMEQAIAQDTSNAKLYYQLGDIHQSRRHFFQAIPHFEKAWGLGLHDYETAAQLGVAYFEVGTLQSHKKDTVRLKKAKDYLLKALEIEKNNGGLSYLGRTNFALGQYEKAIACFKEAINIMKPEPLLIIQMHTDIAEAYEAHGDYDEAIASCNAIKEIEPGANSLRFYTAEMFRLLYDSRVDMQIARIHEEHLNKKEEALEMYKKIVEKAQVANIKHGQMRYAEERIKVLTEELFFEKGVSEK